MIDESFHLTPLDVRRYEFGNALRGYDKARVDQFREQVADELERITRVNQELDGKAKSFHEQLRAYRDRDKALNEALISAQELRAEIRDQADREGQLVLREARNEAERILDQAHADIRRMQEQLEQLERLKRTYLTHLRSLAERQLAEVEAAMDSPALPPPIAPRASSQPARLPEAVAADVATTPRISGSWMDGAEPA